MKPDHIMLLFVWAVATGFAPQSAVQETRNPREPVAGVRSGSRVPVDVSIQGLTVAPLAPLTGSIADCLAHIADQATGGCLAASSTPAAGMLLPYTGRNNTFSGRAFVGGGRDNAAPGGYATVGGGNGNSASANQATVGGGQRNKASGVQATVGGGLDNKASGKRSTVAGGASNFAGDRGTVGGGVGNAATGPFATVGGGRFNKASADYATVGGGTRNTASGYYATVGGGGGLFGPNTAAGAFATVPGGIFNAAFADYSFAAGRRASANHVGSFVWGDSQDPVKASSLPDEFNVYCSGGARFFTTASATTGVLLAPGGGSWSAVSDRDSKENVEPVDGRAILERLVSMPLSTWNYKAQDDSIRHIGPMAQDFRAAFSLGASDKLIDTIDPDGVALAAIQGLYALVQENDMLLAEKDGEIAELRARLERLETALAE